MKNTELSDEQLGRLWCERHERRPDEWPRPGLPPWRWVYDDGPVYALPWPVYEVIRGMLGRSTPVRFSSEYLAYAAVGAALRELHRRAGEIAAVLGGVL
jgi:hypothetical protein